MHVMYVCLGVIYVAYVLGVVGYTVLHGAAVCHTVVGATHVSSILCGCHRGSAAPHPMVQWRLKEEHGILLPHLQERFDTQRGVFCSELVAAAYQRLDLLSGFPAASGYRWQPAPFRHALVPVCQPESSWSWNLIFDPKNETPERSAYQTPPSSPIWF